MTTTNEDILSAISEFAQDVQNQFANVQEQFTRLHSRLDRLENILEAVQRQVDELRGEFTTHKSDVLKRVEYLETELAKIKQQIGFVS